MNATNPNQSPDTLGQAAAIKRSMDLWIDLIQNRTTDPAVARTLIERIDRVYTALVEGIPEKSPEKPINAAATEPAPPLSVAAPVVKTPPPPKPIAVGDLYEDGVVAAVDT